MEHEATSTVHHTILAFVGMPGAGKSSACLYMQEKRIPVIRFGELTEEKLKELGLERNPANEEIIRESLRKEQGNGVYAQHAVGKLHRLLGSAPLVIIDGLYSWEEYIYLKTEFSFLFLIHIYAEPKKRYARLTKRTVRPFTHEQAVRRDLREIEQTNKGGPIAIADYLIDNDGNIDGLHTKLDILLKKIMKETQQAPKKI